MLAYHRVLHGHHDRRSMLTAPATYHDLLSGLLLSKGVHPGGERSAAAPTAPAVRVFDGARQVQPTEHHIRLAATFATANLPRDMARSTGATPEAVAWWTSED